MRRKERESASTHSTSGIQPPFELRSSSRSQNSEAVNQEIVPVILPKDLDLSALILDSPAEEEERELGRKRDSHGDKRRIVELGSFLLAVVGDDGSNGLDDEDHVDGWKKRRRRNQKGEKIRQSVPQAKIWDIDGGRRTHLPSRTRRQSGGRKKGRNREEVSDPLDTNASLDSSSSLLDFDEQTTRNSRSQSSRIELHPEAT